MHTKDAKKLVDKNKVVTKEGKCSPQHSEGSCKARLRNGS